MLTKAQIKRRLKKILAFFFRIPLKNRDFSILSNNCWGGVVYDKYALPYRTPTIGLWIPPKDYIKLLGNLDYYFSIDMEQISYKDCHVSKLLEQRKQSGRYDFELDSMIIGRLDDVDIIFIHYHDFKTAKEKWDKRKGRLNLNNLIVKMNDQNNCTEEDVKNFLSLPFQNKLFFTANEEWRTMDNVVFIDKYKNAGYVVNDTSHGDVPMNITLYLNSIIHK